MLPAALLLLLAPAAARVTLLPDAPGPPPLPGVAISLAGSSEGAIFIDVVNGSTTTVGIDWDRSAFIAGDGRSSGLVSGSVPHADVTQMPLPLSLPLPAVVPVGSRLREQVYSSDHVALWGEGWHLAPAYTHEDLGERLQIELALVVDGVEHRQRLGATVVTLEAAAAAGVDMSAECNELSRRARRVRTWAAIAGGSLATIGGLGALSVTAAIGESTPEEVGYGYLGASVPIVAGAATATPFLLYAGARTREGMRLGCEP